MCARRSLVFVISQRMAQLIFGSLEFVFMITHSLKQQGAQNLYNQDVARNEIGNISLHVKDEFKILTNIIMIKSDI